MSDHEFDEWCSSMFERFPAPHPDDDATEEEIVVWMRRFSMWAATVDPEGAAEFERRCLRRGAELMVTEYLDGLVAKGEAVRNADGSYSKVGRVVTAADVLGRPVDA